MKRPTPSLVSITLGTLLSGVASAQSHGTPKEEATGKAVLVELFTSEGCSSCPPADALLRQINGMKTDGGKLIVGVSEHVTYWNSLGWTDPFSSETYTARQNAYGDRFGLGSVYTPQMVINGSQQIVGSDKGSLIQALTQESSRSQMMLRIASATTEGNVLKLSFSAGPVTARNGVEIFAVLADDLDRSSVLRGENSGRTLAHVAVARSLAKVATVHEATEKTVELPLPTTFVTAKGAHHVILFAQESGLGPVLGIDARPL